MHALLLTLVSGLPAAHGEDSPKARPDPVKVTTRRADDTVRVLSEKAVTVLDVRSPFGISQVVVERTGAAWPERIKLRLHLKGLSSLRVTAGKLRLDAAAAVRDGKLEVRQWKDGKEDAPLDEKSPLWMAIRAVGADGKPARDIPLKGGYFEVTLPRALFAGGPKAITLAWIDFYRN